MASVKVLGSIDPALQMPYDCLRPPIRGSGIFLIRCSTHIFFERQAQKKFKDPNFVVGSDRL